MFVPCCFIGGITGQFFRQFAVTITVSTVISAINAMTMTPSRAVLIFTHGHKKEALPWWAFGILGGLLTVRYGPALVHFDLGSMAIAAVGEGEPAPSWLPWAETAVYFAPGALIGGMVGWLIIGRVNAVLGWLFRGFNRLFDGVTAVYGWIVGKALRFSAVVLLAYGGLLVLTYGVFQRAPTGFIPSQDMGRLIVNVQLPDSASLQRTIETLKVVEAITHERKGVAHTVTIAGLSFIAQANSSNFGSMFVVLDSFDERKGVPGQHADDIMEWLSREFATRVRDAKVIVRGSSPVPGLGVAGGFKLVVEDRSSLGLKALQEQTDDLTRKLQAQPGLVGVATQFRSKTPQLYLDIDRTKVQSMGVSFNDVNQTLSMYLGSLYVNSFSEFGRHWQVTIQVEGEYRSEVEDINLLKVRNNTGQMVPMGTLVNVREVGGPISVPRYNLYAAAPITGSIQPGVSSGDAIETVNRVAAESLPLSMRAEWTELMFMQLRAGNTAMYVFALAAASVFLALASLYESWSLPLAVILVVPLCLLCSVSGVLWTGRDVNIFVQIGLVVLVGLACKNAILIVEYARQLQVEGLSRGEATQRACRLRLRPILMTSFAFIFGVIPLVVAAGAGAEMRRSLGIAVFSGMLGVTLFGIFLTPVFFFIIQGISETRLFMATATKWIGSTVLTGVLGMGIGLLLAQLRVVPLKWGLIVGAGTGVVAALAVLSIHLTAGRTLPEPDGPDDPASSSHPRPGAPGRGQQP